MRPKLPAAELERRRRLAVGRIHEGYSTSAVARFLGVSLRAVQRWLAAYRRSGEPGLAAKPIKGASPKLTDFQQFEVLASVLCHKPSRFAFQGDRWTSSRLAQLIDKKFAVHFNPNYLCAWRRQRRLSPQKPKTVPRQRRQEAIDAWVADDWTRIKKKPSKKTPTSC
jgi:transposase